MKYKSLYEILEPVLKTDASSSPSKNLLVKLKPFLYIQTQHELAYYAGLFLSVEIKLSKNNVERKQALSTLSFLINKNTDLTQVMLEHVLSTDYLSQHYKSTSMRSMFILTPYILIKIEKLMLRMSLNGPIFFREKEQIIKGLIRNIIVAKVQQTFNSCVNNEEKKVVSYLYYLAINKKPEDLKRELSLRFPDPVKNIFYRTLLSINAICQESGSMQRRAVGSVVKSSLERALIDNDVFIEKFSNAVAQHIEVVLTLNYSNFYTQAVFEEILHAHTHPHPHFFMREFL